MTIARSWRLVNALSARPILEKVDLAKPGEPEVAFAMMDDMVVRSTIYTRHIPWAHTLNCIDALKFRTLAGLKL